ncbi:MAG: hypothetical protein Q7R70_00040 [Candidatus Diapherotrites archaeon]|nr:hypothetical protein [Candidatus Diapherotrites archaeon]
MKSKLVIAGILILAIAVVAAYFLFFSNQPGAGNYTVSCNAQSIPCTGNNDCSVSSMSSFCSPGAPNLLKCVNASYYCGIDGFCKGSDCTVQ